MAKTNTANIIMIAIVVGALSGAATTYFMTQLEPSQDALIKEFYDIEAAVGISPHHIRKHLGDNEVVLVDLRSQEEYEEEHVIGALNVPAYKNKDKSDYGAVDRIVSSFKEIQQDNPGKDIIVYCYSIPCMTGRKVGKILSDHGIYVKHLNVGWNEWRFGWETWNHPHEWAVTNVEDFVISGSEPGTFEGDAGKSCGIESEGIGC